MPSETTLEAAIRRLTEDAKAPLGVNVVNVYVHDLRVLLEADRASRPAAVPEGWRLVPEEPTEHMIEAAADAPDDDDWVASLKKLYSAMLAAAPAAQPKAKTMTETIPEDVREFVESYQFDASDEGFLHTPTDNEKAMLEDAINSFMADRASRPAAVPGWRLVPEEPDDAMIDAGNEEAEERRRLVEALKRDVKNAICSAHYHCDRCFDVAFDAVEAAIAKHGGRS